jgi:hypothetical protein
MHARVLLLAPKSAGVVRGLAICSCTLGRPGKRLVNGLLFFAEKSTPGGAL